MYRCIGLALLMAASVAACGGVTDPSQNVKDPFSGIITPGQGNYVSHPFTVSKSGELSITVTSMTPAIPTSTYFEVGFGNSVSGSCQPLQINQFATVGTAAIGGYPVTPGSYCVFLIDEGLFTVPETYTVVVSHP